MNLRFIAFLMVLLIAVPAAAESNHAAAMFERIRDLRGNWQGTNAWSGDRTGGGRMGATYSVTGAGSAVVENLTVGETALMTTVYHLDGEDLRMTHYCAAKNQPRLKAVRIDEEHGIADFSFVDATNLASNPGHVEALQLQIVAKDHIILKFTFGGDGKHSIERIDLTRTAP
jgi:hypothetical protein